MRSFVDNELRPVSWLMMCRPRSRMYRNSPDHADTTYDDLETRGHGVYRLATP